VTPAQAALARNDRYLLEFVERLSLCPFARRCRETGKLQRVVLEGADAESTLPAARDAIARLEAMPEDDLEVALLICPAFAGDHKAFEELCGRVRDSARSFYCVAFHPGLPEDLADANRAVGFIRRSPDPTLQLVRASLLTRVRGEHTGGSVFVDISKMSLAELVGLVAPEALADRIARQNLDTVRREGPDRVRTLLHELHESFRR
jgi:hypothetical protein